MAKIKLNGDTSGYIEISAPAVSGNNTLELGPGTKILTNLDNTFTGVSTFSGDVNITSGNLALASATPMVVASNGSGHLRLGAGGSEKVRITSTGLVGIGTDNPIMRLHVHGAANSADSRIRLSSAEGSGLTIRAQSATENNINADSGEDITFSRGNVESLRITSDGNVGINDTAPSEKLNVGGNIMLEGSNQYLYLTNVGTGNAGIYVRGRDSTSELRSHSTGIFTWEVTGSEKMRITSGGDVVIGNTSTADGAHFQHYQSAARHQSFQSTNGDLAIVTDNNSNPAAYIKGTGTADLLKVVDGSTTVFTIEDGGDVVLGNNCNLVVSSGNGIDFSATANSSGTMSSELLDDYEEGTFTPTVTVEGQSAATTDKQYGRYVKIGKKVTVWCYIQLNGTPSGRGVNNAWQHGGLPFTHRNAAGGFDVGGPILYWTIDSTAALNGTAPYHLIARLFNNSTGGRIRAHDSSNNQYGQNASLLLKDNTEYTYTFTYEVA